MGRVLIVEDDEALTPLLRVSLEKVGHQVSAATDMRAAREVLLKELPDLLLLDLSLPDGNGLEFLREIRTTISVKLPIIVLSAQKQEETVVRGLELGASDYVRKPFAIRELIARISKWI